MGTDSNDELEEARAFVIMPFASEFDDVHDVIKQAVSAVDVGLNSVRLDEIWAAGRISDDLIEQMSSASLCIADVTQGNANVMWEVGFATALKKPLVVINQGDSPLPFDIADLRAVMYDRSALAKTLKEPLVEAIRATLRRYSVSGPTTLRKTRRLRRPSIAVTGTMKCPPQKARSRLERVLQPYLGKDVEWFVGSYGTVDEVALGILVEAGEEAVTVVGYSSYDISGPILSIIETAGAVDFVDAMAEQIPMAHGAPSVRDILMAARCDAFIIGWDGASEGTKELINWLSDQGKDHLVAFVIPFQRAPGVPPRQ